MTIRPARREDLPAVAAIYDTIHAREAVTPVTGWLKDIYPTADTARKALADGELYVMEEDGRIVASGRINQQQGEEYARCPWLYEAAAERVLVLHTLTVDPAVKGRGLGTAFAIFYEDMARRMGCTVLRIDTNARNTTARRLYAGLGYREAGIVPCVFNGIPDVQLVCLEKRVMTCDAG